MRLTIDNRCDRGVEIPNSTRATGLYLSTLSADAAGNFAGEEIDVVARSDRQPPPSPSIRGRQSHCSPALVAQPPRKAGGGLREMAGDLPQNAKTSLPDGARFEEHTYANEAGSRRYKLFVPGRYCAEPLPLIVMLHGCRQSPDDFAAGTRMNELAEEQGFLVAYPGQPPSANSSKCWNWFSAADQLRDRGEPSLIAGITRQITQELAVDPTRVYIAGLSAGGAAAVIMGSAYPDLYAAICVHSGLACGAAKDLPSAFAAMRLGGSPPPERARNLLPTIVFHGDRDNTVNPLNGDQVIAQSKAGMELHLTISRGRSAGGTNYTRTVQADGSGRPILEQWVLHGAGHAWSGGSPAGSYTDPRGPDASREMLRFFLETSEASA
jgi:poly(hydroxyalkanoate) depolymerase family esterase